MKPSIVIASLKNPWEIKTIGSIPWSEVNNVITESMRGISKARNYGFNKCKLSNVIIFVDGDLEIPGEVWYQLFKAEPGTIYMMQGPHFPISRVMSVHREDFERLGGFDENIQHTGEDLDFYIRARLDGITVKTIPLDSVKHEDHDRSYDKRDFEGSYILAKHGAKILEQLGLETRLPRNWLIKRNLRKTVLRISGYLYYTIRGLIKGGVKNSRKIEISRV